MGRYTTRFQGNGSNAVGATYTAAAGGGNSKSFVAANGQVLSRADYPALANYYSGQSPLSKITNTSFFQVTGTAISGNSYYPISSEGRYTNANNGLVCASGSGFTVFAQPIRFSEDTNSPAGTAIWRTTNGSDWSLVKVFEPISGTAGSGVHQNIGVLSLNNTIFLCTNKGLLRSTDGINYTTVYSNSRVTSIATDGVNYILTNQTTSGIRTSDFINYTGVSFSGTFTGAFATFYNGNYYVFQSGVTGVRFSTDSGQTWTSPASGLAAPAGTSAAVLNNNLIVSVSGTGTGLFQYSTNPTGTSNTWAVSPISWVTGETRFITHYLFDGTSYVFSVAQVTTGNPSTGLFAYVTTGLNATGFKYYAPLPNSFSGLSSDFQSLGATTFALSTGTKKSFYLGQYVEYQPTGTNWSGTTNISMNTVGVSVEPFFTTTYAKQRVGVTNSGNRYIHKLTGPDSSSYSSIHVESSGVFKLLQFASGSGYSDSRAYDTNTNLAGNTYVVECSGVYLTAATQTGNSSGIHHNRFYQSTFVAQQQSGFQYTGAINPQSGILGPVNNGVYFLVFTTSGISGVYIKADSSTPITGFSRFSTNTGLNSFSARSCQFSTVTDSVFIGLYNQTAPSGISFCQFTNNTITNFPGEVISGINATGGLVSVSGAQVFSTSNGIYAVATGGATGIYKYSNGSFKFLVDYFPYVSGGPFGQVYIQTAPNVIIGPSHISFDGTPTVTALALDNYNGSNASIVNFEVCPVYINYTNEDNATVYRMSIPAAFDKAPTGSTIRFVSPIGTTGFVVPDIASTVTGEAKYIIAR